jgi:hypothetical protein
VARLEGEAVLSALANSVSSIEIASQSIATAAACVRCRCAWSGNKVDSFERATGRSWRKAAVHGHVCCWGQNGRATPAG